MNHIRIYYHNDLDGVMSAVMYAKLIREKAAKQIFHYSAVNYGNNNWESTSLKDKYNSDVVVVDFAYHPMASVWFDHHIANKERASQVQVAGKFDPLAPSCANVIFHMEGRDKFIDESLMSRIVDQVDMIDNAMFKTLDDVYGDKTFGPKLRWAFQEAYADDSFTKELIHLFVEDRTALYKLMDYNQLPDIAEWRYLKAIRETESAYPEFLNVVQQKDVVVYYEAPRYAKFDRYFSFRYNIDCDYTVYILPLSEGYTVSVSKNPWKSWDKMQTKVNVAEICKTYGGGGHPDVGGIPCTNIEQAKVIQEEVVNTILLHPNNVDEGIPL